MCQSPITIKNNSRRYVDGVSPLCFRVPCGHCKDCLKKQQDDWFVRSFFEYNRVKKCGGRVFFPTFTYDDEHLPWYSDCTRSIDGYSDYIIPCFSRHDIKSFRDKLRVYLSRDGYDSKGIRFIIVSEFGSKRGRPHYHGLFFVPFDISPEKMLYYFRKAWIYGFVGVPKRGLEVISVNAVQYTMKYISKEQFWTKKYSVNDYIALLKRDIENNVDGAQDDLLYFRSCLPNHYQSIGFGMDCVDVLSDEDIINNMVDLSKFGFVTNHRFKFTLPRYIQRKLTTFKDEYGLDVPTTRYKELFDTIFLQSLNNDLLSLSWLQSYSAFKSHCAPLMLSDDELHSYYQRLHYVSDKLPQLIIYNRVYRGVPYAEGTFDFGQNALNFFLENSFAFAYKQKFGFVNIVPYEKGFQPLQTNPRLFRKDRFTFGDLPIFRGFEEALQCIEQINDSLSSLSTAAWCLQEKRQRDLFKLNSYEVFTSIV